MANEPTEAKLPLTDKEERKNLIIERVDRMHEARQRYSHHWETYERVWKMFREERTGEDAWRANLVDTWSFATIKTAQAAFVDSKVSPIFRGHEDDDQMKARDLKDLYFDISDKGELDLELYYIRLDAFKLGYGVAKTVHILDERTIQAIQKFDPIKNEIVYKEETVRDFDDPKTVRISPYLFLIDEMARGTIRNARRCAEIEILGYDDAKRIYSHLFKGGEDEFEKEIPRLGQLTEFREDLNTTRVATTADDLTRDTIHTFETFAPIELESFQAEIIHYWDKIEDTYEIIINRKGVQINTASDKSPIPYIHKELPFTLFPYSPYGGDEIGAAGIIEIGRADADQIVKMRQMQLDRQKLSIFSPVFADVNDEIDQRLLRLKPLSVITTKGGTPPAQYKIPGVTNADFGVEDRTADSFKRAVGIDERVLGVSPEGARLTATEVSFLREAALRRLREFAFLYKKGLLREINLKISLFKQYYSSPLSREEHTKEDGLKEIKVSFKRMRVKTGGNTYIERDIKASLFDGEVDVDLDMRLLVPMTQAQLITKWGQVLRDVTPFVAAGIVDIDIEKVVGNYLDALEAPIESLRPDTTEEAILRAEGEHKMLANHNTSDAFLKVRPDGTPDEFLNASHVKRHRELMETDDKIEEKELRNLAKHIATDMDNLKKRIAQEATQQRQAPNLAQAAAAPGLTQVGGVTPQIPTAPPTQPQPLQEAETALSI